MEKMHDPEIALSPMRQENSTVKTPTRRRRMCIVLAGCGLLLVGAALGAGISIGVMKADTSPSTSEPRTPPANGGEANTPTPSPALRPASEGEACAQTTDCSRANSTCIFLRANKSASPSGICTSLIPDGEPCDENGRCVSGDCDSTGSDTGSETCKITIGESCSTSAQCAEYSKSLQNADVGTYSTCDTGVCVLNKGSG